LRSIENTNRLKTLQEFALAIDLITTPAVQDALRAIRYERPLGDSPLMGLDLVTLRLRVEGLADTRQSRAWALGCCIDDAVGSQLARLRGRAAGMEPGPTESAVDREIQRLREDLRSDSAERLTWGLVYARFMSPTQLPVERISAALGLTDRALRKRVARGAEALVRVLRALELAATQQIDAGNGAAPQERILFDEAAPARRPLDTLGELLGVVRGERATMRLTHGQANHAARHPASELTTYRVGRIAEWGQPRYRLDERFVALSLLVDLGEESQSGRWQVQERRFTDMRDMLAEVAEPAVVLLGPPGSGKSTLLRRLELDLAVDALRQGDDEGAAPVSFLVSLNQYKPPRPGEPPPAPRVWLAERWAARFPKLPPLADLLARGGVVLLLDGLNEMPHAGLDSYRERIGLWKQFLHETVATGRGNRAVIACRSLDYSAPLSTPSLRVPQVRLEPLADEQVREFLERYSPGNAATLWSVLDGTRLLEALRWPFFLRLLVEDAAEAGTAGTGTAWAGTAEAEAAPRGLAALFTGFVRRALVREVERDNPQFAPGELLSSHDYDRLVSRRGWRTPYELPEGGVLFGAITALAYAIQAEAVSGESSQARIGYAAALALLPTGQAEEIVRAGAALGVLEVDQAADEVQFSHQLVQEHFAGRRLAVAPEPERVRTAWRAAEIRPSVREQIDTLPPSEALPALPQTGWEETALQAAVMARDPEGYVRGLMDANLALAGQCANLPEVCSRLDEAFLNELRWALVGRSREPEADLRDRIACGLAVGDLGDPRFERRVGPYGEYLMPPMVEIAGGVYPIGEDEPIEWSDPGLSHTETAHIPRHAIKIAPFKIAQFPTTNAQWRCFMEAGGYDDTRWWDTENGRRWRRGEVANEAAKYNNRAWWKRFQENAELFEQMVEEERFSSKEAVERWRGWMALDASGFEAALDALWQAKRATEPEFWQDERYNAASQPVVGVSWHEARAYCNWLSAQTGLAIRLPTEVEWEAAARGAGGRLYASGDALDPTKGNTLETHVRRTTPVGVFVEGDTPEGVSDMAGNVEQWANSARRGEVEDVPEYGYPYDPNDGREDPEAPLACPRVLRGGAWNHDRVFARAAFRYYFDPIMRNDDCGFRCVFGSLISGRHGPLVPSSDPLVP
jgi:formylglycine-generating enzyme required for sulfatase activity